MTVSYKLFLPKTIVTLCFLSKEQKEKKQRRGVEEGERGGGRGRESKIKKNKKTHQNLSSGICGCVVRWTHFNILF